MLLFSVCLALLLDARRVKARQGFQLAYFLPYAVPGAISALMWTFLLQPQLSPFTSLFQKMGLNLNLLAPSVVPISVGNMITWGFAGYNMVVIYSALKALPNEILEAAHVDGAGDDPDIADPFGHQPDDLVGQALLQIDADMGMAGQEGAERLR